MRFSVATILGLAAIATAQSSAESVTSVASSSISQVASSTSVSLTPQQTCLANCGSADICCQARCVNVPCPNDLQANATTECAAACPQGNGSQEETAQYASCQSNCISSQFFPLSGTAGAAATASGSNGGSSAATTTGGSGSADSTGSGSSSGATASATNNAAPEVRFGATGAGLIGLIVAGLAL